MFEKVLQGWQRDDYDGYAHFGHGPDVHSVPVRSALNRDEASEVDSDSREAKCERNEKSVNLP